MLLEVASAQDATAKSLQVAETILLYQRNTGGWPKNYDESRALSNDDKKKILTEKGRVDSTFDNGATHSEMKRLAEAYSGTSNARYKDAFIRGLDFTLAAQYENGGWPQFYPKPSGYHAHITFNDGAMIGVMRLLKAVAQGEAPYEFVDRRRRERCLKAVERGVKCILACQIKVDGKLTAWCAQHDAETFVPRKARSYELPSISGSESVGIVRFLMEIDEPPTQVIDAIQQAITWFDAAKLTGIRQVRKMDKSLPRGWDKVVVNDPSAPSLWARFHEIGSNKPIYCSRDGVPKETLAEISYERRNGYSWLGNRASSLLTKNYPVWQSKWAPGNNVLENGR